MQDIYLVEDSVIVRKRLEAMLADVPGVRVVGHAEGASEAISDILAMHPNLVLCDLKLKEGTGFDVLRALRERAPEVDCYMLSNFSTGPYRRLAVELGASEFFDKSSDFESVREAIAQRAATTQ